MGLLKDSSTVLLGVTVQRFISLIMIPVIAHLLGPGEYGIFNASLSVCALITIVSGFSLEASIAVSKTEAQAAERTLGTAFIGILSGIAFGCFAYLIQPVLVDYYSETITRALVLMIPVFVPMGIINVSLQNYVGYVGRFRSFAIADIAAPLSGYATLILVYFFWWRDYHALMAAGIMQAIVRMAIFLYASRHTRLFSLSILKARIIPSLWQARNFSKFLLPSNLLNTATVHLPPVLLSMAFSESIVGLFTMASNIISIPITLSGKALGQVFYPRAACKYRETGCLSRITWQTFEYSCQLTLYPAIFTAAAAGFLFPILLGPKWQGITPYILLLMPMILLNAVQTQIGIGFIFSILNQHYKILAGNILLFLCRILPLVFYIQYTASAHMSVLAYSLGSAAGYAFLLYWIFISTSISVFRAFYVWAKYCFIALLCVQPIMGSYLAAQDFWMYVALAASLFCFSLTAWFFYLNAEQRALVLAKVRAYLPARNQTIS